MKILIIIFVQVIVVFCQKQIVKPGICYTGIVQQADPPVGLACINSNEVWACGYGEASCTPRFVCGTPPCHYRCWCRSGYKRSDDGVCVKFCPLSPIELPIERKILLPFEPLPVELPVETLRVEIIDDKCYTGIVAESSPPVGLACINSNEVWACAYGEASCTPRFVCGTPPCHLRCWCKNGYKRSDNGQCVLNCPAVPIKDILIAVE